MPRICAFRGVSVEMYYNDHPPPHFHVYYADTSAIIEIATMEILQGRLPARIRRLVLDWSHRHSAELAENWRRVSAGEQTMWITADE